MENSGLTSRTRSTTATTISFSPGTPAPRKKQEFHELVVGDAV